MFTTALTETRTTADRRIPVFLLLNIFFAAAWIFFFRTATDSKDWWIENILVLLFLPALFITRRKFNFSNLSLICIYLFLFLHIYGAKMAYTHNELGEWLRNRFHLARNPYDRIVHFSFGFLLAYPFIELVSRKIKQDTGFMLLFINMAVLCLATIFELLEWAVAAFTDKATGETYVATQGDPWDAQKDIILALLGSVLVSVIFNIYRSLKKWRSRVDEYSV